MWDSESQTDDDNATAKVHFHSHIYIYITLVIAHFKNVHTLSFFRSCDSDCTGGTYRSA